MNRDSFIFYRSFKDCMNDLSDADKLIMYEAISDYSLDLKEPELTGFPKALFKLIRPILDANVQRWRNGCNGGAPKGNKNNRFSKSTTKVQPKVNQSSTENQPRINQSTTEVQANKDKDKDINNNIGESTDSPTALSFENIWSLYGKKGNKKTSERKWAKLSVTAKEKALAYIPAYVEATPDKQYRKNFETFLNQECWNDELPNNNQMNDQPHETERNYL